MAQRLGLGCGVRLARLAWFQGLFLGLGWLLFGQFGRLSGGWVLLVVGGFRCLLGFFALCILKLAELLFITMAMCAYLCV